MKKSAITFPNDHASGFYFKKDGQVRFALNGQEKNIHGYFAHAMRRMATRILRCLY